MVGTLAQCLIGATLAAVVGMEAAASGKSERLPFVAASLIATVMLTAAIGLALVRWRDGR